MSINDKISIIVPVYNLEKYIERTLTSICNQTYSNIEVIVVDDGSIDNSYGVICEYAKKDSRVVLIHQENGGVTSARLNGVKNATGDWIGFVDGDDIIDEDMYELLINNAKKYDAKISHCGYKMILGDNRVDYYYNTGCLVEQDNQKGLYDLLDGSIIEPGLCNKLFRHTLFHSLLYDDIMDLSIKNYEDLLMNYYLFKQSNKSVFEDVCKYHYMVRNNSASMSSINENKFYGPLKVFEIIMNDSDQESISDLAFLRYIGALLNFSTCKSSELQEKSIELLKRNKKRIMSSELLSKKAKLMFILTAYFHNVYILIRRCYEKITGIDKKYSILKKENK